MEFLRFGSSIPGAYWGCCACCIIQNFKVDPDAKSSIQMVNGDGGYPQTKIVGGKSVPVFAGPTYRDIFWQRLRVGTFGYGDMPNHAFFAILTRDQLNGKVGKQWLAILKEAGFEFIRAVSNSVYDGANLLAENQKPSNGHPNYIFGMFRNIGNGAIVDPFTPPKEWTDLPSVVPEAWSFITDQTDFADQQRGVHRLIWDNNPVSPLMTEEELVKAGAPVVMAGLRSKYPQQPKAMRDSLMAAEKAVKPVGDSSGLR